MKKMKDYKKLLFLVISFLMIGMSSFCSPESHYYKITGKEISKEPISPLLYGNFIELGYGRQVEGMWSEMFFNRSFEAFYPYRSINKAWYDLYFDENHPEKGYETDWSKFDWYHSGYEHNEWYAAPGTPDKPSVITDTSTFIKCTSPLRKVVLIPKKGGCGHGSQYLEVVNSENEKWGALAQSGKLLRKGVNYAFTGMIKSNNGPLTVEIRMYPQGNWEKPIQVIPVKITGDHFNPVSAVIKNPHFAGYATFSLWIPPHASIDVDDFSMKPDDNYFGWRRDVVKVLKEVNPKIIRFPGGCFASFYNWKNGIGPYSERKPKPSYFWGGLNYNDVGTAEYAMLCNAVGAEKQIVVNVYHPAKRKYDVDFPNWQDPMPDGYVFPEFMSLTDGAQSAAEWVAYCNSKAGENKWADLRVSHGYVQPFHVKYWELDNEVHRWFEAKDYAWAVVVYSKAMKAVDPSIKIGMAVYGGRPDKKDFHHSLNDMLAIAGPYIDFVADRGDGETLSLQMLNKVRHYNALHGTHIKYCDTEWLAYNTDVKRDTYNMAAKDGNATKSFSFSKWYYALNLVRNYMAFQRLGDGVGFVNFNNLANTHSQSAMETPKEGSFLTACGKVLQFISRSPAAYVLNIEDYQARENDDYQVQAAWDTNHTRLVLYVCNRTKDSQVTHFDWSDLQRHFSRAVISTLYAKDPLSMNTTKDHNAIKRSDRNKVLRGQKSGFSIQTPPYSFCQIVLSK
jgi:alpha-N-arabinofuranosidase